MFRKSITRGGKILQYCVYAIGICSIAFLTYTILHHLNSSPAPKNPAPSSTPYVPFTTKPAVVFTPKPTKSTVVAKPAPTHTVAPAPPPVVRHTVAPKPKPQVKVPAGSVRAEAKALMSSYGWGTGQFTCLDLLWTRESGWNPHAENPSSGAYGIPQALPGSKMASAGADWRTNALTQIKWGLGYIKNRYGTPCSAWNYEQANGWY